MMTFVFVVNVLKYSNIMYSKCGAMVKKIIIIYQFVINVPDPIDIKKRLLTL